MTMLRLEGKTALITGASGAIGAAIARVLSAQGAQLVLSGTRKEALHTLAVSLPSPSLILPCALHNPEEVVTLWERAEAETGSVDILINNAGVTHDALMMRMKDDDWYKVIQVNLTASFMLCRSAVKSMMKRRYGRIINMASVVGFTGNAGQTNYTASKAGLVGLSKSLAQEVASRGITVNCVAPGFIASPMTDVLTDPQKKTILEKVPAGHMGTPEDIASGVLFLASEASKYITGQTLHINGGMYMG